MIIDKSMIASQQLAGKTKQGSPVLYIMTHGGLHGFFTKNKKNEVETLATAPHKAIAAWMSEKKAGGINWDKAFTKSEPELASLSKSEKTRFDKFRDLLFSNKTTDLQKSEYYFVYDIKKSVIGLLSEEEIKERVKDNPASQKGIVVRNASLNEWPDLLTYHKAFKR